MQEALRMQMRQILKHRAASEIVQMFFENLSCKFWIDQTLPRPF